MASKALNTRNWTATERDKDISGGGRILTVAGEVEVGNTGDNPVLKEAVSQGPNPTILILDLTIQSGTGSTVMNWKQTQFEKPVDPQQYKRVDIRFGDSDIASIEVVQTQS
jgi:hypothetical protein